MRKHRWIRSSMETLSYMWTGHRAEERIGVKITRCPSQWLHSFPQKRAYLECVHSLLPALTLCLSLSAGPCCLHQSLSNRHWKGTAGVWMCAFCSSQRYLSLLDLWLPFPVSPPALLVPWVKSKLKTCWSPHCEVTSSSVQQTCSPQHGHTPVPVRNGL